MSRDEKIIKAKVGGARGNSGRGPTSSRSASMGGSRRLTLVGFAVPI